MIVRPLSTRLVLAIASIVALGCNGVSEPGTDMQQVTDVELALTTVPTGVLCIRIDAVVAGATTTRLLDVAAGATTANLSLGQLPVGSATLNGSAFAVACSASATATAAWLADPVAVSLRPGVVSQVAMTFRRNNPVTAVVNFLDNVAEISVGESATYARMADGTVKQWGENGGVDRLLPTAVAGLTNVDEIAPGSGFACARRKDGVVLCWGDNTSGVLGPSVAIGTGSASPRTIPLPGPATQIAGGPDHACAVVGRNILCWGSNFFGNLGNGMTVNTATPVVVFRTVFSSPPTALDAARVAASLFATCAIDSSSLLYCWGGNGGLFGNGVGSPSLFATDVGVSQVGAPAVIPPVAAVADVAMGGNHSCLLRADGQVRCTGDNSLGQLGNGGSAPSLIHVNVTGVTDAVQLAVGGTHNCALLRNGSVVCWGGGMFGEQGDGTGMPRRIAGPVVGLGTVKAVRAHLSAHTCAELPDLTVRCWGDNSSGQLGDGTRIGRPVPVAVLLQ